MKKEYKVMSGKEIAERAGKEAHENMIKDITDSEKKTKSVLKDSPVGIELADSLFSFYKEVLTPELLVKSTRFSLKVLSILMVNAVDLSQQAAAIITAIPQKIANKGIYIEGLSDTKDRPIFIQEYMDEKLSKIKAKNNNGLKSMGQELREANSKLKGTKVKAVKTAKKK